MLEELKHSKLITGILSSFPSYLSESGPGKQKSLPIAAPICGREVTFLDLALEVIFDSSILEF